ncbi:MAG: hypothetical protein M0C28_39850 [Candidatus Moduliflexus flocculans]|nr:hypothetical protein [Candidatus Moduliflexus flocculans]
MKGESHTYSWADGGARREGVLRRGDAGDCSIASATWTPAGHQVAGPAGRRQHPSGQPEGQASAPTSSSTRGTWPSTATPGRSSGSGRSSPGGTIGPSPSRSARAAAGRWRPTGSRTAPWPTSNPGSPTRRRRTA